jgi:hypothetical protein
VPEILGLGAFSLVLDPELPHDALPCAEAEPFFPLTLGAWPFSGATELRDGGSDTLPFVDAARTSKSISVSSA